MKALFYMMAAAMIAVALALLLIPLLQRGREAGRPRRLFALMLGIALMLPVSAVWLYGQIGTPATLDGVPTQAQVAMDLHKALDALRAHLAAQPNDAQGWMLLAQVGMAMQQPADARHAFEQVLKLKPNDAAAMVGWAQADSTARPDHRINERGREMLSRAVKLEPDNQRGLWLLGISQFQQGQFAQAASTWRTLKSLLKPDSAVAQAVVQQIAAADARAGASAASSDSTGLARPGPRRGSGK